MRESQQSVNLIRQLDGTEEEDSSHEDSSSCSSTLCEVNDNESDCDCDCEPVNNDKEVSKKVNDNVFVP